METDPQVVARLAGEREEENWRFRTWIKSLPAARYRWINALAEELGRRAETQMDCRTCGACCRDNVVPVDDAEAERLAERIALPILQFRKQYLTTTDEDEGLPAMDAHPCAFLHGNECSVYEARPQVCRGYPYIGGDIASRMIGIIERAGVCPIVFEMLEQLKKRTGFRRYQ